MVHRWPQHAQELGPPDGSSRGECLLAKTHANPCDSAGMHPYLLCALGQITAPLCTCETGFG